MIRRLQDYDKLIHRLAKQFENSFKGRKELEDLIQDGGEVFVRLKHEEEIKPLPCPFPVALTVRIKSVWLAELYSRKHKKNGGPGGKHIKAENKEEPIQTISLDIGWEEGKPMINPAYNSIDRMDSLLDASSEMQVLAQLLMDTPKELIMLAKSFGIQESVIKYLRRFKSWQPERLKALKAEMSNILQG